MKFPVCFAPLLVALAFLNTSPNASALPPAGYYLIWSDEFNGTSLDPTKWWVWNQPDRSGYTVPAAVTVSNGYMTITTYTTNGANYSAIVSSDGRFRARFGYWEASVEFNGSPGMFSDFWLQSISNTGQIIGDPAATGAEIDVCEHRVTDANNADNISGMVTVDTHWNGYTSGIEQSTTSGLIGSGLGTGFHTYGLLWNNASYNVSFDGTPMWSTNTGISDRTEILLFSCEVDSNSFCGIVPTNGYGNFLTSTTTTVVDYVRFYAPTTTVYWLGASSANWTDGGNWLSNMIPTSTSDAVFSYLSVGNFNITLGTNTTVNSLSIEESGPLNIYGNPLTINSGGIDMLSALYSAGIYSPIVLGTAQSWNVAAGLALVVNAPISGPGNLNFDAQGTVALEATNSCSGLMTVSNGTLQVDGTITNAVTVAGGILDGNGTVAGPVVVNAGTLSGPATITGAVSIVAGGTLSPGPGIAQLVISNTLTLQAGGAAAMDVNATTGASDEVVGLTHVTYGGALNLNNQSGSFAAGNVFKLFNAASYSGAFNSITPSLTGSGLGWNTNTLALDGTLRVTNAVVAQTTNIVESRFGNSTSGTNNPAFSFSGFSSTISATKSSAVGCTSPGSSRFTSTASTSTSFSVTPSLQAGTTYSVAVSWGYNSSPYGETTSITVAPTATGVSSNTFPATTKAFSSGSGDTTNNAWETIGTITTSVSNPVVTFTYVSGLSSGRWYADAVRFISQPPIPGKITTGQTGVNFILNWQGNFILQSATNISGPYTDLPGPVVIGPYTNTMSATQQFFRLRQ